MPKFTVLSRKDAFVDYVAEVEAESAEMAVELAYSGVYYGAPGIVWEHRGTVEFDACHLVALDEDGNEIERTAQGDFV